MLKFGKRFVVLIAFLTMFVVVFATSGAYSYWAGSVQAPEDSETTTASIVIGEGQEITTVIELNNKVVGEGKLVPIGRVTEATDVEEVVLTFDVLWTDTKEASHGADGVLTITPLFDNNPANLLNVVVDGNDDGAITAGTTKTITLTITLTEPANLAEYELVANETFELSIKFSVE